MMTNNERKKSGAVKFEDYEKEDYLQTLVNVSQKLQKQYPSANFDKKSVGNLIALIKQFMEDALGVKALPPKPTPKIPAKLFQDLSPEGALYHMLAKFHELMTAKGLKRTDFTNPYNRKQLVETLLQVVAELVKKGFIRWPKIYFHSSCGPEIPLLKSAIVTLRGEIAESADVPGVTHHVQPFGPKGDPDDGVQYMRNLGKRGEKALVHWWYYPDSYDEIVELDDAPEVIEIDKQPSGPWKVYTRWLKDSLKYNEWMNPIDYELEDQPTSNEATAGSAQEQAGTAPAAAQDSQKDQDARVARPLAPLPAGPAVPRVTQVPAVLPAAVKILEIAVGAGIQVAPGLIKQKLLQPDAKFQNTLLPAIHISCPSESKPKKAPSKGEWNPGKKQYKTPASASWFTYDAVHALEEESLGKFPEYKAMRNAMVEKYRENPSRSLTFSEACSNLQGDIDRLAAIWDFLDGWGIINHLATQELAEADPLSAPHPADSGSERETAAAALRDAQAVYQSRPHPKFQQGLAAAAGKVRSAGLGSRKPKRRKQSFASSEPYVKEARQYCNAMPGVECTSLRYHCTKLPDVDLCPQAFAEGRFPAGCTAKDFIRIEQDATEASDTSIWSDMDTLLLLEGLELFGDNWAEISDHVGTKSQVQCMIHFLKLPIEDDYMDQLEDPERMLSITPPGEAAGQSTELPQIPFADQGNPVMAQIAFLTAMLGPEVAAAAAQEALVVLTQEDEPQTIPTDSQVPLADGPLPASLVRKAASLALSAAAIRARQLAEDERQAVQKLMVEAVDAQGELLELRMKTFTHLSKAVQEERSSLQAQREALTSDRLKAKNSKARLQAPAIQGHAPTWQLPPSQTALQQSNYPQLNNPAIPSIAELFQLSGVAAHRLPSSA